jgi:SNF2 family DNA or RNA helicase
MGLGKTVTMLAHVASTISEASTFAARVDKVIDKKIYKHIKATLIVLKLSLLENTWMPEFEKHLKPNMIKVGKFHGPKRSELDLSQCDIVLTTYEVLRQEYKHREKSSLFKYKWFRIILDEAHEIRNYTSQSAAACRSVMAERRWAMSGTPFQNGLNDIGSLMAFLQVHPIHLPKAFAKFIIDPIMTGANHGFWSWEILRDSVFLRRTKESLALGLPKKEERMIMLQFEPKERELYDFLHKYYSKKLQTLRDKLGNKIYVNVMNIFMKMRRFCAHKQELLGSEELKAIQEAITKPEEEINEKTSRFNKTAALDLLHASYSGDADDCAVCRRKVCQSDEYDDDNNLSQILCHILPPDCWRIVCDSCFAEYKKTVKVLPGNKIVACELCTKTHPIETITISRSEWHECLNKHHLINLSGQLAKARAAYTGPSVKVKYLLEHLEKLRQWELGHPTEKPLKW